MLQAHRNQMFVATKSREPTYQTARFNQVSVSSILAELKDCSLSRDLARGMKTHSQAVSGGQISNICVVNSLINMYAKCGSMIHATVVFDSMMHSNVVSWTALLQGYVENGDGELALQLFDIMEMAGTCVPDARAFVAALSACADLAAKQKDKKCRRLLQRGKAIHARSVLYKCCDVFVESNLVDMYAKCGSMVEARSVFDKMIQRNVVAWTALIQGYAENGESQEALELFDSMERAEGGCVPNARTLVAALSACTKLAAKSTGMLERLRWLEKGREIHSLGVSRRCCGIFVDCMLIDMYAHCNSMVESRSVFDRMVRRNVVAWNALLMGYVENGKPETALELFDLMESGSGECVVLPDARSFVAALAACADLAEREEDRKHRCRRRWLEKGEGIYARAVMSGTCSSFVKNTMISLCGKCGRLDLARGVFDKMVCRDSVTWNALSMGYVENGDSEQALEVISAMDAAKDSGTFVAALLACTNLKAIESGKGFHAEIQSSGLERDVVVANCLMDFYGKCGDMEAAKRVFDKIGQKSLVSWNTLMCGFSLRGDSVSVLELFKGMEEQGVAPDEITFVCLLSACNHAGLTDKGKEFVEAMQSSYGVNPTIKHYSCLVDLLGRANHLDEAMNVVRCMPFEAEAVTWTTILSASWKWKNLEIGRLAYEALMRLNEGTTNGSVFVLMADLCKLQR